MLPNFEDYTQELTTLEHSCGYQIALLIEQRKGLPIKGNEIIDHFVMKYNVTLRPAQVRKIINYICKTYLHHLIGTSKGYFVTHDVEQLKKAAGTLVSRANENERRAEVIYKHLTETYGVHHGRH